MRNPRFGQPRPPGESKGGRPGFRRHGRKPRPDRTKEEPAIAESMRIAKAMARAGLCSRRDAERWVLEGRVSVNGEILKTPARDVGPSDTVKVDGQPLARPEPAMLWRFHKPRGCVTTHRDPEGRPTVFEKLPKDMPRVVSIGRLDFNTEGLLLLTTDGGLARHFELPSTGWARRYRVRANGVVTQEQLDALKDGIEIDGVKYGPVEGIVDRVQGANVWLTLGIREGKNREVRKILGSLGLEVNRLIRISFGPFQLLDLEEGEVERVKRRVLAEQLGPRLAADFGLDVIQADERPAKNTGFVSRKPDPATEPEKSSGGKRQAGGKRAFGERKPFAGKRDERPDRDERRPPRADGGEAREGRGGSEGRGKPAFGGKRPFGERKPFAGKRDERPDRSERRPPRADGGEAREPRGGSEGRDKPAFGGKRPFSARKPFAGQREERPDRDERRPLRADGGEAREGRGGSEGRGKPAFGGKRPFGARKPFAGKRDERRPQGPKPGRDGRRPK